MSSVTEEVQFRPQFCVSMKANKKKRVKLPHILQYYRGSQPFCAQMMQGTSILLQQIFERLSEIVENYLGLH